MDNHKRSVVHLSPLDLVFRGPPAQKTGWIDSGKIRRKYDVGHTVLLFILGTFFFAYKKPGWGPGRTQTDPAVPQTSGEALHGMKKTGGPVKEQGD
jgi:hypothetical protein